MQFRVFSLSFFPVRTCVAIDHCAQNPSAENSNFSPSFSEKKFRIFFHFSDSRDLQSSFSIFNEGPSGKMRERGSSWPQKFADSAPNFRIRYRVTSNDFAAFPIPTIAFDDCRTFESTFQYLVL